jgi:hypothetical protein
MPDIVIRNFQGVLKKYRASSFSERDKGTRFERLMQAFLKTYPLYAGKFKHIWLWNEFPHRLGVVRLKRLCYSLIGTAILFSPCVLMSCRGCSDGTRVQEIS